MKKILIMVASRLFVVIAITLILVPISVEAQNKQSQKFDALLQMIQYAYVDTVSEKRITDDAIRAVLQDLDPHSVYIPADELKDANEPLVGKFEGVGIQFNILEDTILVTNTISGGPSEKVGILAGDRIVKIEDTVVAGIKITNNMVLKKLRGDKGTKVTVGIFRRGEPELIDFTITRDKIPLYSVDASHMITPEVGYIKVSRFADTTVDEFREALKKLKDEGMKSLVLDLTNNGGGYLNRAIELADEFLTDRKRIVYTEGIHQPRQESFSTATGGWEKGKLAIMIDEYSASASEIVSGAVQDWDRGLIVGRRSFAKGLVQKPFPLPDGSAVRLTVARYYTPSGRCIQKSYEKGDEDYDLDISNRREKGELFSADSIHFSDSLKYFTNARRTVYGGGGIMPDVFVPLDTTIFSNYYRDLQRKGILNEFILIYVDKNRSKLTAAYTNISAFKENFVTDQKFMDEFFAFAEKKEVKKDEEGWKISSLLIQTQLKALVARDLFRNTDAYFWIINDINTIFQKTIESIQNNTFDKLKIAEK
ncbi:MAG: S41 family peptidase [Bacteroidia bacterium]